MSETKFCMGPSKKNNLTFTLKKKYFLAQGVNKYFHEIYFVKNIFEESIKKSIVSEEKHIYIL